MKKIKIMEKRKKDSKKKKEVREIYKVEKDGKEKIVEAKGIIEEDSARRKGEIEKENKLLRNILIFIGIFLLVIVLSFFIIKFSNQFKYKGVKFNIIEEGELIFYHTSFPVMHNGEIANYNIYLRNDPRELGKKVLAKGPIISIEDAAINMAEDFNCNGDGIIAIANLVNLYNALGKNVMKDDNSSCDDLGRYMILNINSGNETNIENFGPNCYNININNCEILEGTERFIVGMLVKINRDLSQ